MAKPRRVRRPAELFVSYAHEDHAFGARLTKALRRHGVETWFAPVRLLAANQWHDEIGKALRRCDWMIVLLSPAAVRSFWVKQELLYAVGNPRYRNRITPLVWKRCNAARLSWTLPAFQAVSFVRRPFDDAMQELLAAWAAPTRAHRRR